MLKSLRCVPEKAVQRITLSKEALDTSDKGYQAPLDESLVKEMSAEDPLFILYTSLSFDFKPFNRRSSVYSYRW